MNIIIIISFIFIVGSCIVLILPRRVALRIGGINRYDLESVPFKYVVWVFLIASLILTISTGLFIYEVKDIISPVPEVVSNFIDWMQG